MLQGTFKGLLIEIEFTSPEYQDLDAAEKRTKELLTTLGLSQMNGRLVTGKRDKTSQDFSKLDTAWQYIEILQG